MIRRCFHLAACLLFALVAAHAQSNYAVVRGSVLDPQHRPVPGARVHLTSTETGAKREVVTNATGLYEIAALQPGSYELSVESSGFQQARTKLNLEVGQQATVDIDLRVGSDTQNITVEAAAGELLKTQDASVGAVVDQRSVDSLPLNGRMLIDLVLTVPGAHIGHGAATGDMNPLYWRPGQRSAVSIGGGRPNANYFLLDGATNTDPTFNAQNLSASPDAVKEFQVQTGSYSAEMGGAGGGQINIVTRSGTGTFHGTAYEFLRNGAMDAHSFNEMSSGNFLVQNNFGGSIGGPIWRSKRTFFFVNYEALRHVETLTMVDTVPTPEEMAGDFSQSGVDIYDPTTTQPNPGFNPTLPVSKTNPQYVRQQFQYNGVLNVIPPDRIGKAASIMLNKYTPQPNTMDMGSMTMMGQPTVVGAGNDANNYLDARKQQMFNDQGTARADHNFSNGDSAFFRYSASGEHGFHPQGLPGFGFYHDDLAQQGVLAWNHIFNSHLVNEASGTISRLVMFHSTESANRNDIVTELGITGTGFGGPAAWGAPYFNIQGYSPLGDNYLATPMHAWDTVVEGRDSLNWQIGRHSTKFGGAYQWFIWPMWGFFQNRGYYQFTNGFTTEHALNDGRTGSALASFELGLPAARQGQAGVPQMNLRQWYANGYGQDAWRIASNTTLTYGLRYEFMSPLVDISYTNSNLDLSSGTPQAFIGGQNHYPRGLMYAQKTNFAPRLGIAQNFPAVGLVAHVAYGIFYTPVDMNTWCNQRHNVPYVFPLTSQSDPFLPSIPTLNFPAPVLGTSVVSFTSLQLHAPAQYIQQWSASLEKALGSTTTLEVGYLGSGGFHLQRSHLINNAQPGPGLIQPRRPHPRISFVPNTVFPPDVTVVSSTFPVSTINLLENTSQSWYDAGYVNVRRRYANGLSFLANYTFAKSLANAPDFRSPMFEAATPQNNDDLNAEKGLGCDIRHRFALSAVYSPKAWGRNSFTRAVTRDWTGSMQYQAQTGFPFTISVFGDTANAGTVVGENPIRANLTGAKIFGSGTKTSTTWINPKAFITPPAYTYGNVGRNSVYGPGLTTMDLGIVREFSLAEKARLEMRGEFFNTFNHTNLGTPNRFVNTSSFGSITEVATPGREVQVSARLSF
jgi:Carboxypeptidase regulatory-like domain